MDIATLLAGLALIGGMVLIDKASESKLILQPVRARGQRKGKK